MRRRNNRLIAFSFSMTEEQRYYTYYAGSEAGWQIKTPPPRDVYFEEELKRIAGVNTFGNPILRVDWGGTLKSDVAFKDTLKYKKVWRGMVGFSYTDDKGLVINVDRADEVPDDKFCLARYGTIELGQLRWFISKWESIEDATRNGRFTDITDEEGIRLFRDPPPQGVYNSWVIVESADGYYRGLDNAVLEEVKRQWHWNETKTVGEQIADLRADEAREEKAATACADNRW